MADLFAKIIGNERACQALTRAMENGRLPHALVLVGQEGTGRRTIAEKLIAAFLQTADALDVHPDFTRVVRETNAKTGKEKSGIGIDQVRELRERLGLSALSGRKAVLIEEADRLPMGAANALLKTLEEPRGEALVILRAPHVESIPATILSRCCVIRLSPVSRVSLTNALVKRGADPEEASRLAAWSGGAPGLALRLWKDGAARAIFETEPGRFLTCFEGSLAERLKSVGTCLPKEAADKAEALEQTLDGWERCARDLLLSSIGCADLIVHHDPRLSSSKQFPHVHQSVAILRATSRVRRDLAHHPQPNLALEHVLLAATER